MSINTCLGIDIGRSGLKIVYGTGKDDYIVIPSYVKKYTTTNFENRLSKNATIDEMINALAVEVNSNKYFIGEQARLILENGKLQLTLEIQFLNKWEKSMN